MSGWPILDVAIGLIFVYLLLALLCTIVNEALAGVLGSRAKALEHGVEMLIQDPELKKELFDHPLIRSLSTHKDKVAPSYLPADKFALALMDLVAGDNKAAGDAQALVAGIAKKERTPEFQRAFSAVLGLPTSAEGAAPTAAALADAAKLSELSGSAQARIESWFNDAMDRVSGSYKRQSQMRALILAALITLATNADTKQIVSTLWRDPSLRAAVIEEAKVRAEKEPPQELPLVEYPDPNDPEKAVLVAAKSSNALSEQEQKLLGQLLGWSPDRERMKNMARGDALYLLLAHVPGWLMTIFAVSLGAPFWFDVLQRVMNVRNAGRPPADRKKEKEAKS